jgi:hypothetical protein
MFRSEHEIEPPEFAFDGICNAQEQALVKKAVPAVSFLVGE